MKCEGVRDMTGTNVVEVFLFCVLPDVLAKETRPL